MGIDWTAWLAQHAERDLRPPRAGRAHLRLIRWQGGLAVAKDYRGMSRLYRSSIGRLLIGREARIYRRLRGCPGIPRLLARPLPDVLILEYVPGRDLRHLAAADVSEAVVPQLERILTAMHERRVLHFDLGHDHTGDLGRETNLIWADDHRLFVVDLAGAIVWPRPLSAALFRMFALHDQLAIVKIKRRFFPALMGPDDEALVQSIPQWEWRVLRRLRKV